MTEAGDQGQGGFPACASKRVLGKNAGSSATGKSDRLAHIRLHHPPKEPQPACPECGASRFRLYRAGLRYLSDGASTQRWLCRDCGSRFSEKGPRGPSGPSKESSGWHLKAGVGIDGDRRVCVALARGAKNLDAAVQRKTAAGTSPNLAADTKGLIAKYLAYLEREGYAKDITYPKILSILYKRGANLSHPENVKQIIAAQPWKPGYKLLAVYAYDAFCAMEGMTWQRPEYKQEDAIVFVPDEKELDQLIAACRSRRMATFLQCLKETYADPGEILRVKWIDLHGNILTINAPVKRHLPGQATISNRLVAMLNALPRNSERIFPTSYVTMRQCFNPVRTRAAARLQNPRLKAISFKSFRHWGGTMLAHYTNGNVLAVKKALRHRAIQSTMKYIGLLQFKDDDYEVATATTVEEIKQLAHLGFQKFDELNGMHVFRRPKRFSV